MNPEDRIIVALDVNSPYRARELVYDIRGCTRFKIGHYLIGHPDLHADLLARDFRDGFGDEIRETNPHIFWDFKYFDIPDTVYAGATRLLLRGSIDQPLIDMCTVHAETNAMKAAVQPVRAAAE